MNADEVDTATLFVSSSLGASLYMLGPGTPHPSFILTHSEHRSTKWAVYDINWCCFRM